MNEQFTCYDCHRTYTTEDINKIPTKIVPNGKQVKTVFVCFNCNMKTSLEQEFKKIDTDIVNE